MKRTFKRIVSLLLAVVMVFGATPLSGFVGIKIPGSGSFKKLIDSASDFLDGFSMKAAAATYSGTCGDNLTWTLDTETGALVINGTGAMTNWSSYSDVPWYDYYSSIKTVTISHGVTSIGNYAFCGCICLTSIEIPDSVTNIGDGAFYYCTSLTSVKIPDSVISIGYRAFYYCESLTSIKIPDSVTCIGDDAFLNCVSLTSVTIGNSVTSMGNWVFAYCDSLTSVTIKNGATSIGDHSFYDCDNLTSITIPDSVTSIGDCAFDSCSKLTSVTIGNSVTSISLGAFAYCDSLTSVTIGNNVTSIGDGAFLSCDSLARITIPDSVTIIYSGAFHRCTSLTDVYYLATEEEWNAIYIGSDNESLTDATIHFNYVSSFFDLNPGFRAMLNSDRSYIFSEGGSFDTNSFEIELLIKNDEAFIEGVSASQTETISAIVTLPEGFSFLPSEDVFAKRIEFSPIAVSGSAEETLTVYVTDPEPEKPLQISAEIFKESSSEPIRKTFCSITATSDESFLEFELPNGVYVSADERSTNTSMLSTMGASQESVIFEENWLSEYVLKEKSQKKIENGSSIILDNNLILKSNSKLTINGSLTVKGNIDISKNAALIVNGTLNCTGDITVSGTLNANNWVEAKNITSKAGNITINKTVYLYNRLKISTYGSVINMTAFNSKLYAREIFFDAGTSNISAGEIYTQKIVADGNFKTTDSCKVVLLYKNNIIPTITKDGGGFYPNLVWIGIDQNIKNNADMEAVNDSIRNVFNCSSECWELSIKYNGNFVSSYTSVDILTEITTLDMLKKEIGKARKDIIITDNNILTEKAKKELKEAILISRAILYSKSCEKLSSYSPSSVTIDFVTSEGFKVGFTLSVNTFWGFSELTYGTYYVYTKEINVVYGNKITGTINYANADYLKFGNSVDNYIKNEWKDELANYIGDGVGKGAVRGLFKYGLSNIYSVPLENVTSVAVEGILTKKSRSSNPSTEVYTNSIYETVVSKEVDAVLSTQGLDNSHATSIQNLIDTQAYSSDFDLTPKKGFEDKYLIQAVLSYLGLSSLDELTDDIANSVTTLDLSSQNIKSIEGLQNFTNLQNLYLDNNYIYDLSPVSDIETLTYLSADKTCLLKTPSIPSLQYFSVADCLLEDIGALNSMTNLRYLDINQNYIFSIDAVLDLVSIILLNISGNSLDSDIGTQTLSTASASDRCAPVYLYADDCGLADLSIFDLSNIKKISASSNEISSTKDICMPDAETIDFSDNEITDINFIENSPNLKNLDVSYNNISELPQVLADRASGYDSLNLDGNELRNTEENQDIMNSLSGNVNGFEGVELGIPVSRVDFVLNNNVIDIRKQVMLSYIAYPLESETDKMIWTTSDESVLTIKNGIITPKSLGEAIVSVTNADGEILGSTIVTIVEFETVNVEEILISTEMLTLESGQKEQLHAFCLPLNATTRTASWSSDNPSVVSVDKNGLITALIVGTATITVTSDDGGLTAECEVTVEPRMCTVKWNVEGNISEQSALEGNVITLPENPQKSGYKFVGWTPAVPNVMPAYDLTFTAVFEKSYVCPDCGDEILGEDTINAHIAAENAAKIKATVKIKNNPGSKTINYGETLRLTAITTNMPADAKIYWYVDGEKVSEGETFEVSPSSGSVEITVKIVDSSGKVLVNDDGNEISDSQKVSVNSSFWQKIVSFFKNLFGINRTVVQIFKVVS